MTKKKVLIIEDLEQQRIALQDILEGCGFDVYSAGNAADARRLAELHWEELDVAVLDMELRDPHEPRITGADIAIESRKRKNSFPPESLVYSLKDEIDYYRLALRLGAAAYLLKGVDDLAAVIQHVRVLALRHALSGENPRVAAEVARVAAQSRSQSEAILTFCRRVLKPEFESCLGAPFVILFTEGDTTQNCADNTGLPGSSDFYHTVQALAHGKGNLTEPFILEKSELGTAVDRETGELYDRLNLTAFLPLSLSSNLRLSIGILHEEESERVPVPTDESLLCTVLAQYLRSPILEIMINLWSRWSECKALAVRANTAKLCLLVGQEIRECLDAVELERVEDLANDLSETGQLLIQIENESSWEEGKALSIRDVVMATWELVIQSGGESALPLDIQGDCTVEAQRADLEVIISRLLLWLTDRHRAAPLDVRPLISIKCEMTGDGAAIVFEDTSFRLHKKLREDMFAPFTQAIPTPFSDIVGEPSTGKRAGEETACSHVNTGRYLPLYLAKMLVEGRYQGLLEDRSDDIKDRSYGHRILMRFPAASETDEGFSRFS